jgi:zinc protease
MNFRKGARTIAIVATLGGVAAPPTLCAQDVRADSAATSFEVDGVRVILRRNSANDVVAANLYLLGGTRQLTEQTEGIETLMLETSEAGTRRFPKPVIRSLTARLGSTIVIEPALDWTVFRLKTLRAGFDSSWAVFADRVVAPRLDSVDVERARAQLLTAALRTDADPDAAVEHLAEGLIYAGHPYRLHPTGTAASLRALTPSAVRRYHDAEIVRSRLLVVIVGNIGRDQVERAVHTTLGTLPAGSYQWTPPPMFTPAPERAALLARELPTNYVLGYYVGPRPGTHDYAALRIATAILSGRLFAEVRSRRNLAYAVEAPFVDGSIALGGFYVTTTDPAAALDAMHTEVLRLQRESVDPAGLHTLVGQFITDYFLKNETNGDQASFLARAELYSGDYHAATRFVSDLTSVTPDEVRSAAQRYMHDTRFGFLGDTSKVTRALLGKF